MRKGHKHSEETKKKIGRKSKGRKPSEETRCKMRESQQRAGQDPELRKLRSENAKKREAQKREEETNDPQLAEERRKARNEAVRKGWENRSRELSDEVLGNKRAGQKRRYENPEERERISRQFKGVPKSPEHIAKVQAARKGWKPTPEQRENMRRAQQRLRDSGYTLPTRDGSGNKKLKCLACKVKFPREEIEGNGGFCNECITHSKLCDCGCGEPIFRYTKEGYICKYSDEHRSFYMEGNSNPNWKGGTSFEPYDNRFDNKFKESIRDRQNRVCADYDGTCRHPKGVALHVHHIDEDKLNSVPENCIALCISHHSRSQHDKYARGRYEHHVAKLMQKEAD